MLKKLLYKNYNEQNRVAWIKEQLLNLPKGSHILDAGAGEQRYKEFCQHLNYVSQDFCQYNGEGDGSGLQMNNWNTSSIDIVGDITEIDAESNSFDAILCSEVFEHIADPVKALKEFSRLIKPGGTLILTAPFASLVHFAPYHFCTGFSKYWYEHHLPANGFEIMALTPNGDWFGLFYQEIGRFGPVSKKYSIAFWPLAYMISLLGLIFFKLVSSKNQNSSDLGCYGWHCRAVKK